jgi:hypothetical protein
VSVPSPAQAGEGQGGGFSASRIVKMPQAAADAAETASAAGESAAFQRRRRTSPRDGLRRPARRD